MPGLPKKIEELMRGRDEESRRACLALLGELLLREPENALAWYSKACCHDFLGEEREAEPCYSRTYELGWRALPEGEQSGFFVGFGSTLRNNLKFEESIARLEEGASLFPESASLKVFLALSFYSAGKDRQAAETLFSACLQAKRGGLEGYDRAIGWYVENLRTHPQARD